MNTNEYHSDKTFKRCHRCKNNMLPYAVNSCALHGALRADDEECKDDAPLHSGNIHDETNALQKGGAE